MFQRQKYKKMMVFEIFFRFFLVFNFFILPLHSQKRNDGGIAQLVRAHDS